MRIEPAAPVPGEAVKFLVDEDNDCSAPRTPTTQISGNVITIVQPFDPIVCGLPPTGPYTLSYEIGQFAAGDFIVRYSAVDSYFGTFGPVDIPFTVAGTPHAIPASNAWGLAALGILIAVAAVRQRWSASPRR